jgi:alpha-galactosidase
MHMPDVVTLRRGATSVVLDLSSAMPAIAHLGVPVDGFDPQALALPVAHATLDAPAPIGLLTENGTGFLGRPGLVGSRPDGSAWAPVFTERGRPEIGADQARFLLGDAVAGLDLDLDLSITEAETLVIALTLRNVGSTPFSLVRLSASVPMPVHATELVSFTGRWCKEFQPRRHDFEALSVIENRRGRTSHDQLPAIFAGSVGFGEHHGDVWGVQLAWSGNYEIAAEKLSDGRRHVQAGELLSPGEVVLDPGSTYRTPDVVIAPSRAGITPASQRFHRHVRQHHPLTGPRKVILNTWEAVYFDHDLPTLQSLAEVAAEVGVERFVLDDGWFGGRRDDTKGLGDWWVSEEVWPDGLHPIADHVTGLGMEFGLWVEPEMVNPDSDLYREHPEWTLTTAGYTPVLGRNQLVLDCGRVDVRRYLFERIDALLDEYDIAYLKWDMNRDLVQGSSQASADDPGRAGTHGHVLGLYELLDQIRARHPTVEIESCASGGGRVDLEILRRTDRVWTSDCNDALERQAIQRGFTMLFPPEVMGAHIGPHQAHTTHRVQDLGFRTATALFGSLGIEWNLLNAGEAELDRITRAIDLHKRLRPLLHGGDVVRVDHDDPSAMVHGVVSADQRHAVMAYVQLTPSITTVPLPMRFAGLDPTRVYRCTIVDDLGSMLEFGRARPPWMGAGAAGHDGTVFSGAQLMVSGLQPPVLHPESVVLLEFEAV